MPGYGKVNMTMKTPTGAAQPAASAKAPAASAAPVTGQPGVRGSVPTTTAKDPAYSGPYANQDQDDKMNYRGKYAPSDEETMQAFNEQRRVYGGKYVRESAAQRAAREFEFYLKNLG